MHPESHGWLHRGRARQEALPPGWRRNGLNCKESSCSAGDLGSIPGWADPLEKKMATYSNILAWRIPWTEKPGGLLSMG